MPESLTPIQKLCPFGDDGKGSGCLLPAAHPERYHRVNELEDDDPDDD